MACAFIMQIAWIWARIYEIFFKYPLLMLRLTLLTWNSFYQAVNLMTVKEFFLSKFLQIWRWMIYAKPFVSSYQEIFWASFSDLAN